MMTANRLTKRRRQKGNILILSSLSIFMLASFAALALDSSLLYVARNELQNAADAGALAGTQALYLNDGTAVNPGANQIGHDTAEMNNAQNTATEVDWVGGNVGDVERGHWSFATRQFTPNASLLATNLFGVSDAELDANLDFINAVKVTTRRQATPVQAILASVFGVTDTVMEADAVAYIGFAGKAEANTFDQPIAICEERLKDDAGSYSCAVGTFIPSNNDEATSETGGWTNFSQKVGNGGSCDSASTNEVRPLVCSTTTNPVLAYNEEMGMVGGQLESVFKDLWDCWSGANSADRTEPWNMKLPVIQCDANNPGPCNKLVGSVVVDVMWVVDKSNKIGEDAPRAMKCPPGAMPSMCGTNGTDWVYQGTQGLTDEANGIDRWNQFVDHFHLQMPDGSPADYDAYPPDNGWRQKTIYFLPSCDVHVPSGGTGGENYGVLARIPVLVE